MAVRLLLVVLMLVSLAMSASLPRAFEDLGLWVGGAYALQQIGRTVFMVIALRGHPLEANFQRILAWCVVSSAFAVAGGLAHGSARSLLWLGSVGVDLVGGAVGFATPGLGRSRTSDWTIEGGHFAERCQAFILIALGESIVIIGATLTDEKSVTAASVTAFVVAFAGSVALWWLYFDQSAEAAAEKIARSDDPGRLGRSAYHLIHPVMVAGIIVCAAADEKVLADPGPAAPAGVIRAALCRTPLLPARPDAASPDPRAPWVPQSRLLRRGRPCNRRSHPGPATAAPRPLAAERPAAIPAPPGIAPVPRGRLSRRPSGDPRPA